MIGFSTTGKSSVGQEVARQLGWEHVDTDDTIVKRAGSTIEQIFADFGEAYFRQLESQALAEACEAERAVISAGGGAVLDGHNRELMKGSGFVVCLEAAPRTIRQRLLEETSRSGPLRPLLAVPDPLQRIEQLKEYRQPYYAIADWTVHTDNLTPDEVAHEVIRGWYYRHRIEEQDGLWNGSDDLACEVVTATEQYPVLVGWGLLASLGERLRQRGLHRAAHIISDETVFSIYGARATKSLEQAGIIARSHVVRPGELSKSLETAAGIFDWLVQCRAERGDTIIALGGGVVGDLAGFVAATFLRGMPLVHVPTSLVAMVDASVGGKTAVNHPRAKNLIGVFHQPRLVVADAQTLSTLPQRELASGWAEVVKHGLILNADFLVFLEASVSKLLKLEPETTVTAIKRSAAIKAMIVSEDEKETGRRTLLNYGHTMAHGLEAATGYERFLHGEAVAIGMTGAALLSNRLGLLSWDVVQRQSAILRSFGLPTGSSGVDPAEVLRAMELDKKVREKTIRWVLLTDAGRAVIVNDVAPQQIAAVLDSLLGFSRS